MPLRDLGDLRPLQVRQVRCDLLHRGGQKAQRRHVFGEMIQGGPCRETRVEQAQSPCDGGLDLAPAPRHRREGADGSPHAGAQDPLLEFEEAFDVTAHLGHPARDLEAEGDRQRVLSMRPARLDRLACARGEIRHRAEKAGHALQQEPLRRRDLHRKRRVEDVLRGRAPMNV